MKSQDAGERLAKEPQRQAGVVRVLYCIDSMALGGTEKQLAALIGGLDRARFEPLICTLRPSTTPLAELGCQALELSLPSLASPSALRPVRRLRQFIRQHKVEIVHTFFQDSTLVGLWGTLGTPVRRRIVSFRDLGFWRSPRNVWPLRLSYHCFDGFIANARAVASHVNAVDRIPLDRIEIIPNGVRIRPVPSGPPNGGPPVVGIVANLNRTVKRVDLFLSAAHLVRRAVPTARFVIVGDGEMHRALSLQAEHLGLGESVRFVRRVADVDAHVASFDVAVLSSDSEGLSNAILEYMMARVPTVARRVGGNPELVEHGVTGLLVDGDSAADLAQAIVKLLQDPTARRQMGCAARKAVEARYSMEAYLRHHEQYYDRLLCRRPPT